MTRGRAEQRKLEEMWEASRLSYEQARRRQNAIAWISYHQRLADTFHGHAARHVEARQRYERLLKSMYTTDKGAA